MDKLNPGKVVEVAMLTGDKEVRGNNSRLARMLTASVNVACTLRTVEIISLWRLRIMPWSVTPSCSGWMGSGPIRP